MKEYLISRRSRRGCFLKRYFFFFIVLALSSTCQSGKKNENEALIVPVKNNSVEEFSDPSTIIKNEATFSNAYDENDSLIVKSDNETMSIKYISWENVITFIDYKTFTLNTFDRMTGNNVIKSGTYTMNTQDNITFLDINFDNEEKDKWLVLANGTLCDIYKSDGKHINAVTGSVNRIENIDYFPGIVIASSYLVENGVSYLSENLKNNNTTDKPWVEGVNGYGINEKLFFEKGLIDNGSMHISIGYVSYEKPYLYYQNTRPKTIKLSVEKKFSIVVDLKDTPHYQEIIFPASIDIDDILVFEILDVYPGIKYDDTCINTIIFEQRRGHYEIIDYWENHP